MTWFKATVALACLVLASATADARPKQPRTDSAALTYCASDQTYRTTCSQPEKRIQRVAIETGEGVVGGRPSECQIRIRGRLIPFCGCGVSLKVFGRAIPELFLAANWKRKFPRAQPAAGMVAARSGHVMYIISYIGDGVALVYDPNSGGGKTRIHERSLRGYTVVDPNGNRVAMR